MRCPRVALSVAFVAGLSAAGCEKDVKNSTTRERSEVVQASGSAAVAPPPPVVSPVAVVPHKLCEAPARPVGEPKKPLARKAALGAKPVGATLPTGKWTWVNLWAAWCAPCKEEMPRLQTFATRLAQSGHELALAFVSLDDDERQLEQFLADQPEAGVRATYWLREGHERDEWLGAVGIKRDPTLPVQLLFDPKGKIRCIVNGAIADHDFAEIAAIVGGT